MRSTIAGTLAALTLLFAPIAYTEQPAAGSDHEQVVALMAALDETWNNHDMQIRLNRHLMSVPEGASRKVRELAALGYANLSASDNVQFRIFAVTPKFIRVALRIHDAGMDRG